MSDRHGKWLYKTFSCVCVLCGNKLEVHPTSKTFGMSEELFGKISPKFKLLMFWRKNRLQSITDWTLIRPLSRFDSFGLPPKTPPKYYFSSKHSGFFPMLETRLEKHSKMCRICLLVGCWTIFHCLSRVGKNHRWFWGMDWRECFILPAAWAISRALSTD